MSIKGRIEKLERAGPPKLLDPKEMTDEQLLAEIRKYRNYPPGYDPTDEELMDIITDEPPCADSMADGASNCGNWWRPCGSSGRL